MKHLFIINPVAGGVHGRTEAILDTIRAHFEDGQESYELYLTTCPMDAAEKVRQDADSCRQLRVYACGGDGTLNECVCGAALRPHVAVCPYPIGTGNDFIKTFGKNARQAFLNLDEILTAPAYDTDLIECNDRWGLNICSVGVDARIGTDVHKYSSIPLVGGKTGYITSTVVNLIKGVNRRVRVRCGEYEREGDIALICACNGTHYGGSFNPVPEASPADGLLNFLVVRGVSRAGFVKAVGKYARGRYRELPELITPLLGTEMEIDSDRAMVVNVDGEAMTASSVRFRLARGAVKLIVPPAISETELFRRLYPAVEIA